MAKYEKRQGKKGVTWSTRVDVGIDPKSGRRKQSRVSARTKRELDAKVAELRHRVHSGTYADDKRLTLGEYLQDLWLPSVERSVKPGTRTSYEQNIRLHIVPVLGKVRLGRLSAPQVEAFYRTKLDEGLSPNTVRMLHVLLHQSLKQAERWGYVARNVVTLVDAPRATTSVMATWTAEQASQFLAATANDDLGPLWHLAIVTGMRRGELLGLRWSDIDWRRRQIAVRRTVLRLNRQIVTGTPKSGKDRTVSVAEETLDVLRRHRDRQQAVYELTEADWGEVEPLFVRADGQLYDPSHIRQIFQRTARDAGVPVIRFHDLRHTAATLMMEGGIHPKVVQEQLGHSSISITLGRYSHVAETMQRDAARTMAENLGLGANRDQIVTETVSGVEVSAPVLENDE